MFKPWFYTLVRDSLHVFFLLYLRFKTGGLENIPRDSRGVILAPNHASYLDPPAVAVAIKRHVAFMAKDYLFRKPVLGRALRWLGVLPIKTAKEDFRSVRELIRKLKQGYWIVVFPEGTRSSDGRFKEPEAGIGFLAMKSGAWVVPIYVGGAYEAFPRQSKWPRPVKVWTVYGKPFIPAEECRADGEGAYLAVAQRIMDKIKNLKDSQSDLMAARKEQGK